MRIIQTGDLTRDTILTRNDTDWTYNGLDCCVTLEILYEIEKQLDETTAKTYEFSRALQAPVMEMSLRGLRVDNAQRDKALSQLLQDIQKLSANLDVIIEEGIGVKVNWRSPTQLKSLFYDVMGLPVVRKRNAQGRMTPTANREAIERLSQYYWAEPICNHLLALRDADKKRQFLQTGVDPDGRMRTLYNIAGTNTGRLSASESIFGTGTNLMNVGRDIREIFVADPGMKFCNLDLEQADARNVGARCWNLFVESHGEAFAGSYLDACESGDLHTTVCRMAWTNLEWPEEREKWRAVADQIAYRNDSYRDLAKKLGHGTNFYGQPATMAKHTKVQKKLIQEFQHKYFTAFPCISSWHEHVKQTLREFGFIETLLGRRRYFHGRVTEDTTLREAIAYEPQSLTADEIDLGILRLWREHRVQLLLQVHDSILFQYPEEEEDTIVPWAIEKLRTIIQLKNGREFCVPVEAQVGWNYGKKTEANPDGLAKWKGGDDRQRKRKVR